MLAVIALCLLLDSGLALAAWQLGAPALGGPLLVCHCLVSLLFSWAALQRLQDHLTIRPRRDIWLFLSLSLTLPVVGMFGLYGLLFTLQRWFDADRIAQLHLRRADRMTLSPGHRSADDKSAAMNTGKLIDVLQHSAEPAQRIEAILATLRLPDHDAINILRVALRDGEDDIRLLAYALLAQVDKRYFNAIQTSLNLLDQAGETQKALLCKRIAQEYWELVWVGLARGETARPILDKALHYAQRALEGCADDAGLQFLLGKILLRLKRHDEARVALWRAELEGMATARITPYLREMMLSRHRAPSMGAPLSTGWQPGMDDEPSNAHLSGEPA